MLLAIFAAKEKNNVILEVEKFSNIRRGFSGSFRQLNPTHSSVSELPLPGVIHLSNEILHVIRKFNLLFFKYDNNYPRTKKNI